ncbi:MAG: hypothetical protein IT259_06335 [Saprospiraceae bacterium]|nr:hypothetical protein [Saprospiraceae bacterium]
MYQMSLPLPDQNQPLRVEWERGWNHLTLHLGDQLIGTAAERADLDVGRTFYLPDGQSLIVVLRDPELEIWYRGAEVVNGIANGQRDAFSALANSLQVIGGIQCVSVLAYWLILPPCFQWPMAVVMGLSGLSLMLFWKKMYSRHYKRITWLALFACITILPLLFLRGRGPHQLMWKTMKDLIGALYGKPPRFLSAKGG